MASTQGQDVVLCQLCPNPVEHHCNLCCVDLCSPCTLKHLADKTNRHEIVEFINRKKGHVLPECDTHKKNRCELYCKDCHKPACALCVTTTHKKHNFTDIGEIIEDSKQRIIRDLAELKNVIVPKYRNVTTGVFSSEYEKVLIAIQYQEDEICKEVRDIGSKMRDDVTKQKRKSDQKHKEIQDLAAKAEKELFGIINISENILKSSDATSIMTYESRNDNFRNNLKETDLPSPYFLPGLITREKVLDMFGGLKMQEGIVTNKHLNTTPVVLITIKSRWELWTIACDGTERFWISSSFGMIGQIDKKETMVKNLKTPGIVIGLSIDAEQNPLFIVGWADTKIYKIINNKVVTLLDLFDWYPRGIFHKMNGELLVSMRSEDKKRSKILRYSGKTEIQVIEKDSQGNSLLSVDCDFALRLTENGNENICVADYNGKVVVVLNSSGVLRFKYNGNIATVSKPRLFGPSTIVTDEILQILISDTLNNSVHVIDCEGNFIRYIEYPCTGGISVDADHNLVAGEETTKIIRVIKYLERSA